MRFVSRMNVRRLKAEDSALPFGKRCQLQAEGTHWPHVQNPASKKPGVGAISDSPVVRVMASSVLIDGGNLAGAPAPPPARGLDVNDPEYQANKRMFGELLESETARLNYRSRIQDVIQKDLPRLIVDMNDLRLFRPDIAQRLLTQPMPLIPPFEDALNFVASHLRDDIVKPTAKPPAPLRIGYERGICLNGCAHTHVCIVQAYRQLWLTSCHSPSTELDNDQLYGLR